MAAWLNRLSEAVAQRYVIDTGDSLYRPCIFPLPFSKSSNSFQCERAFHLVGEPGSTLIEGSLVWRRLAPTLKYVHKYGCRLAHNQTREIRAKGKLREAPRIYCGSYGISADAIRSLRGAKGFPEILNADVVHKIEENREIAHAALVISLRPVPQNIESIKTKIAIYLWKKSIGPFRHVCRWDSDWADHHPSALLTDGPSGENEPHRSASDCLREIIRFKLDNILLQSLLWLQDIGDRTSR